VYIGLSTLALTLLAATAGTPAVHDMPDGSQLYYNPGAPQYFEFGASIDTDGEWMVVGATGADGSHWDSGDAHVFRFNAITDEYDFVLSLGGLVPNEEIHGEARFGHAVVIAGDAIVIGAPFNATVAEKGGQAYLFRLVSDQWQYETVLVDDIYIAQDDRYAHAMAVHGQLLAIGAPGLNDVYMYSISPGLRGPRRIGTLSPPRSGSDGEFGWSVAMDANTIVVGAPTTDDGGVAAGMAYVFDVIDGSVYYNSTLTVTADWLQDGARFGHAVDVDADNIVVGTPFPDASNFEYGSAAAFRRTDGTWSETAVLSDANSEHNGEYGWSVAVREDLLLVGIPEDPANGAGTGRMQIYRFTPSTGGWSLDANVVGDQTFWNSNFGHAVHIGDYEVFSCAVHMRLQSPAINKSGAVFAYDRVLAGDPWQNDVRLPLPVVTADEILFNPEPKFGEFTSFGYGVAISSNTALVGAPGANYWAGAVHMYQRADTTAPWEIQPSGTFPSPTLGSGAQYGNSIALDDDLALVAARGTNPGRVAVSTRNGDDWTVDAMIVGAADSAYFGSTVCMHHHAGNDYFAIADESMYSGDQGKVDLYRWDAGTAQAQWIAKLPDATGANYGPSFGNSIDLDTGLDGTLRLAVGAPFQSYGDEAGDVYVFAINNPAGAATVTLEAALNPSLDAAGEMAKVGWAGSALDLHDDLLFIGAPGSDGVYYAEGAVFVYGAATGGASYVWAFDDVIRTLQPAGWGMFGSSIDYNPTANRVVIGEPGSDYAGPNAGLLWVVQFDPYEGAWRHMRCVMVAEPQLTETFGIGSDSSGSTMVVAAPGSFNYQNDRAYVHDLLDNVSFLSPSQDGSMANGSNWSIPPYGSGTALFSNWLSGPYSVLFDLNEWTGSMRVVLDQISLKLLEQTRTITGDVTIGSSPLVKSASMNVSGGSLVIGGDLLLGGLKHEGTMRIYSDAAVLVGGQLLVSGKAGIVLDLEEQGDHPRLLLPADAPDLAGTVRVDLGGLPDDNMDVGDRFVLIRAAQSPTRSLFKSVCLPGLKNDKAFQITYGPIGGGLRGDCPPGEIADCYGNCAPANWVGDGWCDDGSYSHNGNLIYFNCDNFGCDGGDCADNNCFSSGDGWEMAIEVVSLSGLLDFGDPNSVAATGQPTAMEVVDLNNDGADEICVTFAGAPGTLAIFENDGSGGVAQQIILPVHDGPVDLTSGDFDGDGNIDLAVAHYLSQDVVVLYNDDADPSDGFTEQVLPAIGPVNCVTRADIDETFPMDLMACIDDTNDNGEGAWQWWKGQAALRGPGGGLGGGGSQGSGPGMVPIFGDPSDDEDQKNHVAHGGTANGRSIVVKGNQVGGLASEGMFVFDTYPVGANPGSVASGDFNGDTLVDLAYTSITNGTVVILLQDPDSSGDYLDSLSIPIGDLPTDITSIDFDNDGNMDLAMVVQVEGEPRVRVLQNEGGLIFTSIDTSLDESVVLVDAGDISGNGNIELVTVGGGSEARGLTSLLTVRSNATITCPGDTDYNGDVDVDDLLTVLSQFGPCPGGCSGDFNDDGAVTVDDLLTLIGAWGPCPR